MKSLFEAFTAPRKIRSFKGLIAFLTILTTLALMGCAEPTGYTKSSSSALTGAKGYGYSEKRINGDEFSIVVLGNPSTSKAHAAEIALLRAAHLTKEQGRTHFVVIKQKGQTTETAAPISFPLLVGGVLVPVPVGEKTNREPMAILLIHLLPPQPAYPPDALNAAEVIEQLAKNLQ